jgi:hypothetical protein
MFAACLAVAQREYPEVNRVYEGASMTSAALQQMLWPLFKRSSSRSVIPKCGTTLRISMCRSTSTGMNFTATVDDFCFFPLKGAKVKLCRFSFQPLVGVVALNQIEMQRISIGPHTEGERVILP